MAENEVDSRSGRTPADGGPHGTVVLSPDDLPSRVSPDPESLADTAGGPALVGLTEPFVDRRFRLRAERVKVGRDPGNDVVLDQPDISLEHARIVRSGGEWRVVDLRSTNGMFINGKRVQQGVLQYGDHVAFGPARFIFAPRDMSSEALRAMRSGPDRRRAWWIAGLVVLLGAAAAFLLFR